jgi:hypothetical protein
MLVLKTPASPGAAAWVSEENPHGPRLHEQLHGELTWRYGWQHSINP